MSFFDKPKNAGTALWIIGIVEMIIGLVNIVYAVVDENTSIYLAAAGLGGIIIGFLYFGFGKSIRSGAISSKWDIVTRIVLLSAMSVVIAGIFTLDIAGAVVGIIIGLIIFFIYKKMTDGKATMADKLIWILLVICFIIGLIGNIGSILDFSITSILSGICGIIVDLFVLLALFDGEIRTKMGM